MPPSVIARRAAQIRDLLDRGALGGLRVPLRNGGTLPAELFAKVALGDLARLSVSIPNGEGRVLSGMSWRQLAEDIELLHEVVLAHDRADARQDRVPAQRRPRRLPTVQRGATRAVRDCEGPPARAEGLLGPRGGGGAQASSIGMGDATLPVTRPGGGADA